MNVFTLSHEAHFRMDILEADNLLDRGIHTVCG